MSTLSDFDQGWLTGFTEGEGSFMLKTNGRPHFQIAQKNNEILQKIMLELGFGYLRFSTRASRYLVEDMDGLRLLLRIFNGRLKTQKKQIQFKRWLAFFNSECLTSRANDEFDTGWIVGFTEAEGSFFYRRSDGFPAFHIVQKGERDCLEWIKSFFGFGRVLVHDKNNDSWRYDVSRKDLPKIRDFFDGKLKHPKVIERFNLWRSLFDYTHPIRVVGREHEKFRSRETYRKYRQKCIDASRRWKQKNREKVREYKRRWWRKRKLVKGS